MQEWGKRNQAIFDPDKSEFAVLSAHSKSDQSFRLLGSWFEPNLRMDVNVQKLIARAKPKIKAIPRCRRHYGVDKLVTQYKAHVLCLLEINVGGFYHALGSILQPLDRLQKKILIELGLEEEEGFLLHNLAPLAMRRDIAMLGLLYRIVHGFAHADLQQIFPWAAGAHGYQTRTAIRRHEYQLAEERIGTHWALYTRSLFGLTRIWNRLPEKLVTLGTVTDFQKALTEIARKSCRNNVPDWSTAFSPRRVIICESIYHAFSVF